MRYVRGLMLVFVAMMMAVTASCAAAEPPAGDPSIRGEITALTASDNGGTMLVESTGAPVFEVDKAQTRVDDETTFLRETGSGYEAIGFEDLAEGDEVDVWFEGPVAESYPVQAYGGTVVVR